MKKFYYLLLFVLIATVAVSCDDGDEKVERFLEIAPADTNITLSSASQSKAIEIKMDKTNRFEAKWIGGDWGKVEPTATGIVIYVDENVANNGRIATIMVVLAQGGGETQIKITQDKHEAVLGSFPGEVVFSQLGGQKEIVITTNQSDWQVEVPTADWVEVEIDRMKGRLLVDVIANTEDAERSIEIVLSSANAGLSKKVKVTQMAIQTYMLPFLGFGMPIPDMREFEEARGSRFNGGSRRTALIMRTTSSIMPNMNYSVDHNNLYYITMMEAYFNKAQFDDSKYLALTNSVGYEYIFDEPTTWGHAKVSWNEATQSTSIILDQNESSRGYVIFSQMEKKPHSPIQDKEMPTLTSFPYGFHTMGASFDEVKAWEAENGGIYLGNPEAEEQFKSIAFITKSTPVIARVYLQDGAGGVKNGVSTMVTVLDDISLAMFPAAMTNVLTHEFKALLAADNWVDSYPNKPALNYEFDNVAKGLHLKISETYFEDLEGYENQPVLVFTLTSYVAPTFYAPMVTKSEYCTPAKALQRWGKGMSLKNLTK